ncbi:hypothetical protein [Albibacterium bauzanense]|uniref:Uncharacterized protein n=1 Tax=Albibacterium bauzanense TaxID=653929 RepID=A0A4V2PXV4_9SPHI|nr:hypothetical protein [Albibacterium bauzanense]TCK83581.1 hypothetical protein C8N28_2183 [Albibacterium bauzanense]
MKDPTPPQYAGKQLDLHAETLLDNEQEAKEFFQVVRKRLLRSFEWYDIAKIPAATFVLTDHLGRELIREMKENDLIRIDIPGPGNSSGNGFDWVKVEKITEEKNEKEDLCSITLRPTSNPEENNDEIAHFFKSMATSTLLAKRQNLHVRAEYHGRNELINEDATKLTDKFRNIIVGLAAKLGLSYSQWKSLIEGLVDKQRNIL